MQGVIDPSVINTGLNALGVLLPVAWLLRLENRLTKIEVKIEIALKRAEQRKEHHESLGRNTIEDR